MNTLLPWRSRLDNDLSRTPFETWLRHVFADDGANHGHAANDLRIPPADVAETENDFVISVELPGSKEDEIDVKLSGDTLVVSGERKHEVEKHEKQYRQIECSYGAFERRFTLPPTAKVDPKSIRASFKDGILEIHVQKVEPRPMARIPVKAS